MPEEPNTRKQNIAAMSTVWSLGSAFVVGGAYFQSLTAAAIGGCIFAFVLFVAISRLEQ